MTITKERLAEIKARCEAATEGPWEQEDCRENHIATATGMDIAHAPKQINAQFIAHARTDVPALLTEVERLRELMARWVDPSLVLELLKAEKNALKKEVERLRWLLLTAISTTEKCPWCRRPHNEEHSAFCQAFGASFTPEG